MGAVTSRIPAALRLGVVALLVLSASSAMWYTVTAKGNYTEGMNREPGFIANYIVDDSDETIEIQIVNATPMFAYWNKRVSFVNDTDTDSSSPSEAQESMLDEVRICMSWIFAIVIFTEVLALLYDNRWSRAVAIIAWVIGLLGFVMLVPFGIIGDFGGGEDDESRTTGGFDTGSDDSASEEEFAHFTFEDGLNFGRPLIEYTFVTDGFDLGLVPAENRSQVIENAPESGDPHYDSRVRFEGAISLDNGPWLSYWLSIPLVWVLVSRSKIFIAKSKSEEE